MVSRIYPVDGPALPAPFTHLTGAPRRASFLMWGSGGRPLRLKIRDPEIRGTATSYARGV
jgi:hypothetical protein